MVSKDVEVAAGTVQQDLRYDLLDGIEADETVKAYQARAAIEFGLETGVRIGMVVEAESEVERWVEEQRILPRLLCLAVSNPIKANTSSSNYSYSFTSLSASSLVLSVMGGAIEISSSEGLSKGNDDLEYQTQEQIHNKCCWFEEQITDDLKWSYALNCVLQKGSSKYQDIALLDTKHFGKILLIDGKMQSAEADEFIYHECLIHPALLIHPNPKTVFIMGGGEGSAAREALRHKNVNRVVMSDIDQEVVDFCRRHLTVNQKAFHDEKLDLVINDAKAELEARNEKFDVIVGDLADPVEGGPCYQLYTKSFYENVVKSKLSDNGIFVTQAGPAGIHTHKEVFSSIYNTLKHVFKHVLAYTAHVPSFVDTWGWVMASDQPLVLDAHQIDCGIKERIDGELLYLNGAFLVSSTIMSKSVELSLLKETHIYTEEDASSTGSGEDQKEGRSSSWFPADRSSQTIAERLDFSVLDIKLIGNAHERYRLLLSDSVSTQHAMLATQLNDRVKSGSVKKGSVVQLIEYICSTIQNRKIIVVLNMETIIPDWEIIGNPKLFSESASTSPKTVPERDREYRESTSNNSSTPSSSSKMQNFRPTVQPPYKPPPNYRNHGAIMKNEAPARIIPIAALNPYQGRWAIKARVTAKGDVRRYNNARGDGKVFSFDLLDSDGGEIRVTCFNAVVDRFCSSIEVGKVYLISKGNLKPAQKNFNHLKNEWEIFLEAASSVELCVDEDDSIPKQQFSLKSINEIENLDNNSIIDVIGIVVSINPVVPILRKNGLETQRRNMNLKDASGRSVELTLWGEFCNKEGRELQELLDSGLFPVLAVKAVKVNDFSGKSIGTISATLLFINPDIPEARKLQEWFDRGGKDAASQSISRDNMPSLSGNKIRKTVSQIKDEGLGRSDKPDWIMVKATVTFIKTDTFCYTACPLMIGDRQCNKKVIRSGNKRWQCERCNQEFEECEYRYLLQAQVQDHTGLTWVTAFQESGEEILGCSAKELYLLKNEEQDDERFGEIIRSSLFKQYLFRLKIKEEMYGEEQQVKITVVKAEKLNYSSESTYLLDLMSKITV
ncbi:hypothetical protein NE237_024739 [Protea cynaroides]|uniref:Replication protein A subunit n=1 Tax=Protea cynaroides TaxID=273540 RepID=A0A9Q0H140_9MAGN|nr:hypothetical protein NE237_024739 [Protea cynaroides]